MATIPPRQELDLYKLIRVKGPDEINWNMLNIQRSLRFLNSLFKATGDHCVSALQTKHMWVVDIRSGGWCAKKSTLYTIVQETINSLQLPDNVGALRPDFYILL